MDIVVDKDKVVVVDVVVDIAGGDKVGQQEVALLVLRRATSPAKPG